MPTNLILLPDSIPASSPIFGNSIKLLRFHTLRLGHIITQKNTVFTHLDILTAIALEMQRSHVAASDFVAVGRIVRADVALFREAVTAKSVQEET